MATEREYCEQRAAQEQEAADRSSNAAARRAHVELAELYRAKARGPSMAEAQEAS